MYIDSPLDYCPRRGCYVLLDQTRRECQREHGCPDSELPCPLEAWFRGIEFRSRVDADEPPPQRR